MAADSITRLDSAVQERDLAWGRNAISFLRGRGLETEFNDWCGGWPCPVDTSGAVEIGRLASRMLEIAPDAGLCVEINIRPKDDPLPLSTRGEAR